MPRVQIETRDAIKNFTLPWMNSEIRKAMNKRQKILRACDGSPLSADNWSNYKRARNKTTTLLRNAECGIKSKKQFCRGLSTESMLISMTESWKLALDNGLPVGAVFIDFQKAFDTVSHSLLSRKLQAIGISSSIHEWIIC